MDDTLIRFLKTGRLGELSNGMWMREVRDRLGMPVAQVFKGSGWVYGNDDPCRGCLLLTFDLFAPGRRTLAGIDVVWNGMEPELPAACGVHRRVLTLQTTPDEFLETMETRGIACRRVGADVFRSDAGVQAAFVPDKGLLWIRV